MINTVAIIGRANVGKSTLFNRLAEKRQAMVSNIPGTTRDLKYAEIDWQGNKFELIDTGGFLAEQDKPLRDLTKREQKKINKRATDDVDKQVENQARLALKKARVILFVVDGREGLNPQDKQIADYLRKAKDEKTILAVNKCDNPKIREQTAEFHKLGFRQIVLASAVSGSGTGDLLDLIVKSLGEQKKEKAEDKNLSRPIRVAIVGKPNVGKSSLLNSILDEERAIVSPIPHTTREPNDVLIEYEGQNILIIDTAGIRKKAKVEKGLEKLGVSMTISTLRKSDTVLLLVDMSEALSKQDLKIGELLAEAGVGVIIVVNKYDLMKDKEEEDASDIVSEYRQYIYKNFPHLDWAPIIFASAKTGWNVQKILKLVLEVEKEKSIQIPDSTLNRFLKSTIKHQPPPRKREGDGSKMRIRRAFITDFKQIDTSPPTFKCMIDTKEKLPEDYRKYIINRMRDKFGFKGVPIKLAIRRNKNNRE